MKDCVRFAPMIGARPGELSPGEAHGLEKHVAGCARCRAAAADLAATEGLVRESLAARANARDFAPFVDAVMERIGSSATAGSPFPRPGHAPAAARPSLLAWLGRHRRAAAATLAPVLAALAVIVYVRLYAGRPEEVAALEISAEGEATMILETADGPVVLLDEENGS